MQGTKGPIQRAGSRFRISAFATWTLAGVAPRQAETWGSKMPFWVQNWHRGYPRMSSLAISSKLIEDLEPYPGSSCSLVLQDHI